MKPEAEADTSLRPAALPLRGRREYDPAPDDDGEHRTSQSLSQVAAHTLSAVGTFLAGALAALTLGAWLFTVALAILIVVVAAAWYAWRWVAEHHHGVRDADERIHAVKRELDRIERHS